jgi:hypothetical protein
MNHAFKPRNVKNKFYFACAGKFPVLFLYCFRFLGNNSLRGAKDLLNTLTRVNFVGYLQDSSYGYFIFGGRYSDQYRV